MDMLTTFEFVLAISRVFGIFSFRVHKLSRASTLQAKTLMQSKVMLGAFAIVQCLVLVQNLREICEVYEPIWKRVISTLNLILFTLAGVIMYVSVITKTTILRNWLNKLNNLCLLLEANYDRLLFWNRILVLGTFLNLIGMNGPSLIQYWISMEEFELSSEFFESLYMFIMLGVTSLFSCQFLVFTNAAGFAYKQANEKLGVLRKRPELLRNKILKLQNLKAEDMFLKDYLDVVKSVYIFHEFLCIFWSFLSLVCAIVNEITSTTPFSGTFHLFLWVFYLVFQMVMILAVCQATVLEAEKTANYVHELFLDNDDPEIKEEIEIFSLQLQHRKVEFNACGFFKLDFTLLYSMIGAVTTYIIILMQFQREEPSPSEWQPKKIANCSQLFHHYAAEDIYRCLNTSSCPA